MNPLRQLRSRVRSLFRRRAQEREMAEEMRAHLELQEEANRALDDLRCGRFSGAAVLIP